MIRVSFVETDLVEVNPATDLRQLAEEFRYEIATTAYRILTSPDDPTEYDESVLAVKVGKQRVFIAVKVVATRR